MKLLAPVLVMLLVITSITSGVASAQSEEFEVRQEDVRPMDLVTPELGIDWMEIWASYWWLIVIALGSMVGLGLTFVLTRGLL